MRRSRMALMGLITAAGLLIPAAAAQASTGVPMRAPGNGHTAPREILLPGGFRATFVHRNTPPRRAQGTSDTITNYGDIVMNNYSYDNYVITDQPTNSNGRLANHLYMWQLSKGSSGHYWSSQVWEALWDSSDKTWIFKSTYNGSQGGVAYGCINVPSASRSSGVQLIVYSCSGYPTNEKFYPLTLSTFYSYLLLDYDQNLTLAIGSNFPGNGAYVISYTFIKGNWKEQWVNGPAV